MTTTAGGLNGTAVRLTPIAVLSVLAGGVFAPAFGGYGSAGAGGRFQLAVLGSTAVPIAASAAVGTWTRLAPSARAAASAAALAGYVTVTVRPGLAVLDGPKRLLTGVLPVRAVGPELAAVVLAVGLAALCGVELVLRGRSGLPAVLPPLACAVAGLAVSASAGPPAAWLGPAFAVVIAAHLAVTQGQGRWLLRPPPGAQATIDDPVPSRRAANRSTPGAAARSRPRLAGESGQDPALSPGALRIAGLAVTALVATAAALVIAPITHAMPARNAAFDARSLVAQPVSPRSTVSPLTEFPALHRELRQSPELTIHTGGPVERLRAATLTEFDGTHWTTSATYRRADRLLPSPPADPAVPGHQVEMNITVDRAGSLTWLPAPGRAVRLSIAGMGLDEATGDVVVPSDRPVPDHYTVTGTNPDVDPLRLQSDVPVTTTDHPGYEVPAPIRAAATEAANGHVTDERVAKGQTAYERVANVRDLFRRSGRFRYNTSADAPAGHGLYQIGRLLTEHRGTAEQYASALAVMLRSLGYQARVVFGYLPSSYDKTSGASRITGRDAHAWTEVRFVRSGWVTFDPSPVDQRTAATPAGTRPQPPAPDPGDSLPAAAAPAGGAGGGQKATPPVAGPAPTMKGHGSRAAGILAAVAVLGTVVALAGAVPGAKALRAARRRRSGDLRSRVAEAWREATDRLTDVGLPIHAGQTGGEVTAAVRTHLSARVSSSVADLVLVYQQAVFAPRSPSGSEADRAWALVASIRRRLRDELSPRRRLRAHLSLTSLRVAEVRPARAPGRGRGYSHVYQPPDEPARALGRSDFL
jgi:transglutaminase-like putative cysteine protease